MHYRDTVLEIDMNKAFHNIDVMKNLNGGKKVKAIVKANAYGHGLCGYSKLLDNYNKVDSFGVSNLDEALALRKCGVKLPIMVLGAVNCEHFQIALDNNIAITCYSPRVAEEISKFKKPISVHIKVDTGMNRIGFQTFDVFKKSLDMIVQSGAKIEGLYSHLSSADSDDEYTLIQIDRFRQYVNFAPKDIEIHVQNTAGILNYKNIDYVNTIRPGIGLYGINISDTDYPLQQIATLKSMVIATKMVDANESIGYNRTYETKEKVRIGTVPIGYADGYKLAYGKLFAYIDDRNFPIRGKVCMDQIMIQIDKQILAGDYVTFIGENCSVSHISSVTGVSPYEILTSLSARLYKKYLLDGIVIHEENQII